MKVIITNTAKKENQRNIDYLLSKWGKNSVKKYILKFEEIILYLEKDLYTGIFEEKLNFYKILVVKQIYILYKKKGNIVLIFSVWNNHKNPYWL